MKQKILCYHLSIFSVKCSVNAVINEGIGIFQMIYHEVLFANSRNLIGKRIYTEIKM